jgi:hypothetical protein
MFFTLNLNQLKLIFIGARKFLWHLIKKAKEAGMTIILSSHRFI